MLASSSPPSIIGIIIVALVGLGGTLSAGVFAFMSQRRATQVVAGTTNTKTLVDGLSQLVDQLQEELKNARTDVHDCQERCQDLQRQVTDMHGALSRREIRIDELEARVAGLVYELAQAKGRL